MQVRTLNVLGRPVINCATLHREFDPSFTTVAKAWAKVPAEQRNSHFFATADFDNAMGTFSKVRGPARAQALSADRHRR